MLNNPEVDEAPTEERVEAEVKLLKVQLATVQETLHTKETAAEAVEDVEGEASRETIRFLTQRRRFKTRLKTNSTSYLAVQQKKRPKSKQRSIQPLWLMMLLRSKTMLLLLNNLILGRTQTISMRSLLRKGRRRSSLRLIRLF